MTIIQSSQNSNFKLWKSLLKTSGIKKNQGFLLMGRKLVPEFLKEFPNNFSDIISPHSDSPLINIPHNIKESQLSKSLFNELDIFNTNYPILVGKLPKLENFNFNSAPEGLEVLSSLSDPTNLGTLARSCEAFDATKIILLKESAHPFLPKTIRASSGSILRLPLFLGPSIQNLSLPFYVLDKEGTNIINFPWPKKLRLLMGEEGQGVPDKIPQEFKITIPMNPNIESLNAVTATSIALFHHRFYTK